MLSEYHNEKETLSYCASAEYSDGTMWGQWCYDAARQVLVDTRGYYEVDLDSCKNGGDAMDWVLQVAGKHWATSVYIGDLVRALDALKGDLLRIKA